MANIKKHLQKTALKLKKKAIIGLVRSEYNPEITQKLEQSCLKELNQSGVSEKNILQTIVPGAFEIPYACQHMITHQKPDIIITLGALIKGETPHFEYIASATTHGIIQTSLKFDIPIIFGILTTHNASQAHNRIQGGKKGDKGIEAAQTAIRIINTYS